MQVRSRGLTLLCRLAQPGGVTCGAPGGPAGAGRNPMADCPQEFDGGLGPAVRSVQHLNTLFVGATMAPATGAVTRTDQRNVLRT